MAVITHGGTVPQAPGPDDGDPYTYLDAGKRRWVAPFDFPEPIRGDANGFETDEHRSWDFRMMERRQQGIKPTDPMPEPFVDPRDDQIARVAAMVQEAGSRKVALQRQLREARDGKWGSRNGIAQRIKSPAARIAEIEVELAQATKVVADARQLEQDLRGEQLRAAGAGSLRHNPNVQPLDNLGKYYSINPTPVEPQP